MAAPRLRGARLLYYNGAVYFPLQSRPAAQILFARRGGCFIVRTKQIFSSRMVRLRFSGTAVHSPSVLLYSPQKCRKAMPAPSTLATVFRGSRSRIANRCFALRSAFFATNCCVNPFCCLSSLNLFIKFIIKYLNLRY